MTMAAVAIDTKPHMSGLLDRLLTCPNEIIVQVLAYLVYSDLLAARQTSRSFHALVHKHEEALAKRQYDAFPYKGLLEDTSLFRQNDLSQIVEIAVRGKVAAEVASTMAERITDRLHFRHTPYTEDELKAWKTRKAKILVAKFEPALFVLYGFFVKLRQSIWDVAEQFKYLSDEDYLGLAQVFDLDQQYMIEKVWTDSLIDITESFRALQGVSSAKGLVIGRHGRIVPGTTTIRSHIAFGGFHAFTKTFCASDYTSGQTKWDALVEELWRPKEDGGLEAPYTVYDTRLLSSIHHLRNGQDVPIRTFTMLRRMDTQLKLIEEQSFWEKAALTVMQRKGIVRRIDPDIPTIETWMREVIAEKGDPWFEFGRWSRPDEFVA